MTTKVDTQSVTMEFDLPHSPAKVWRALTVTLSAQIA
jgi:uncharacterized protein YndB with AHSA1/START domain